MGWWSETILGGDEPLDELGTISDIIGIENLYPIGRWKEDFRSGTRQALEKGMPALVAEAEKREQDCYATIYVQVLATVCMAAGATIPDRLLEMAREAGADDTWAKTDSDRAACIENYLKALDDYRPGEPRVLAEEGLFEAMNKTFREGQI